MKNELGQEYILSVNVFSREEFDKIQNKCIANGIRIGGSMKKVYPIYSREWNIMFQVSMTLGTTGLFISYRFDKRPDGISFDEFMALDIQSLMFESLL